MTPWNFQNKRRIFTADILHNKCQSIVTVVLSSWIVVGRVIMNVLYSMNLKWWLLLIKWCKLTSSSTQCLFSVFTVMFTTVYKRWSDFGFSHQISEKNGERYDVKLNGSQRSNQSWAIDWQHDFWHQITRIYRTVRGHQRSNVKCQSIAHESNDVSRNRITFEIGIFDVCTPHGVRSKDRTALNDFVTECENALFVNKDNIDIFRVNLVEVLTRACAYEYLYTQNDGMPLNSRITLLHWLQYYIFMRGSSRA